MDRKEEIEKLCISAFVLDYNIFIEIIRLWTEQILAFVKILIVIELGKCYTLSCYSMLSQRNWKV